jgi:hypothetical protein
MTKGTPSLPRGVPADLAGGNESRLCTREEILVYVVSRSRDAPPWSAHIWSCNSVFHPGEARLGLRVMGNRQRSATREVAGMIAGCDGSWANEN